MTDVLGELPQTATAGNLTPLAPGRRRRTTTGAAHEKRVEWGKKWGAVMQEHARARGWKT